MPQGSSVEKVASPVPAGSRRVAAWKPTGSCAVAMVSDPGRVRQANEDACGADLDHGAYVLCDGMGGAAAGEIASKLARDTFLASLARPGGSPAQRLAEAVRAANHAVYRQAQRTRAQRGMGTTLVGVLLKSSGTKSGAWVAHVGDSRCYRLRAGTLDLLTRDHSLIEEQVQAGLITRLQAESSPIRNIITRAIGSQASVEPEIAHHELKPGDLLMLVSDGLTRELTESAIAALACEQKTARDSESCWTEETMQRVCAALVDAANHAGGRDNITVLLLSLG